MKPKLFSKGMKMGVKKGMNTGMTKRDKFHMKNNDFHNPGGKKGHMHMHRAMDRGTGSPDVRGPIL